MTEILFAVALLVLNVVLVLMAIIIKRLSNKIDEMKLYYRIKLQYLESCELDNEKRIDQLEDMLELKEWLDEEKGEHNGNND